jgi:hypothetical protein
MCYHAHYIFLACGHSVSSLLPLYPSKPCPTKRQPSANEIAVSDRPFSFDPSVSASPTSPLPDPCTPQTPWRLEGPFSTPESAPLTAAEDEEEKESRDAIGMTVDGKATPTIALNQTQNEKNAALDNAGEGTRVQFNHCGQIHTHPYRSYKLEGLCLHCRRRRDNLLASFEVNSIRESVYREAGHGAGAGGGSQKTVIALPSQADRGRTEKEGDDKLQPLPYIYEMPMPMPMPGLGRSLHSQAGLAEVDQQQQQQTPWRLTLPAAEVPRTGWGLAGMRYGEWI